MSLASSIALARTGAYGPFPVDTEPTVLGTDEVQTITIGGTPTPNLPFYLLLGTARTRAIYWTATNATLLDRIKTALERLSNIGTDNVTVAAVSLTLGVGTVSVTFVEGQGKKAQVLMTADDDSLTGGTVAVAETTPGVDCSLRGAATGAVAIVTDLGSFPIPYINTGTPTATIWALLGVAASVSLGSPALGTATAVHAAVTDTGSPQTITTAITSPPTPRNITATAGGTAGDIKAISVTIHGTDYNGDVISEVLPAFTVDTAGIVTGSKAFKTVTSIVIPAHDGTGATTAIGLGAKLGLDRTFTRDTILNAYLAGVREATRPTVAFDPSNVSGNTVTLNSALAGTAVRVDYYR